MTETPEQRVARLERELAEAKVTALQKELDEARAGGAAPSLLKTPQHLAGRPGQSAAGRVGFSTWLPGQGRVDGGRPDARLAPAPRDVPSKFRLVVFPFSFWTLFAIFMVTVTPIALWIFVPISGAIAAGLTFALIAGLTLRRNHLRAALLKWGEVATVTNSDLRSRGTYYSGTTYSNVRMAQAHGWTVERKWYSGPGYKTRIDYQVGSGKGSLVLRGLPYDDGVILADPRNPARALCVSSYPYALERDESGNWVGQLSGRVLASSVVMTVILVAWTVAMIWFWAVQAASIPGLVRSN